MSKQYQSESEKLFAEGLEIVFFFFSFVKYIQSKEDNVGDKEYMEYRND